MLVRVRSAQQRTAHAVFLLLSPILILSGLSPATGAQDSVVAARLDLISIPPSHGPEDRLGVRVRVVNEGEETLEGFRLTLGGGGLIRTRSDLENSFEGAPVLYSFTLDFLNRTIPPGESRRVEVDPPVADLVGVPTEGGVHPLSLSLFSADDTLTPLNSLATQVMVYPGEPLEPLNLVTVLPLNEVPARDPDGLFVDDGSGRSWMESATAKRGWLRAVADSLEVATAPEGGRGGGGRPLHIAFAPTPRLIDELAAMTDGFARVGADGAIELDDASPEATAAAEVLETLREVTARPTVRSILVPYSYPDLPSLEEELSPGDVGVQLTEAITVLGEHLNVDQGRGWVFPPAGRVDDSSLQALQAAGVDEGVFFAPDALEHSDDPATSGCPIEGLSFVCQVRVETDVGPIHGYVADAGLQQRLGDLTEPDAGALEIQRIFAEMAMIHAEQPGTPGRVLQATVLPGWHPTKSAARAFFSGLRDAPWLRPVTPEQGLERSTPTALRRVAADATPPPGLPDESYFEDVAGAQSVVQSFSTFLGEREPRGVLQRLRRNILVAEGRALWDVGDISRAASYATDSLAEADDEMAKVTLGVPSQTTFTSRTGTLDVSLFNETGYPVEAKVVLRALDMNFDPSEVDRTFEAGTNRLSIEAEAQTSGTFPIEVRVETPDGYTIASEAVQVRSTEFNVVALAITFGAVAFLILFYVVKAMRRRGRHEPAEVGGD
jgi:Family of unknown function (DUF6049)